MKLASLILLGLLAAAPARADYPATVLADHPVGYWRLNALPANNTITNLGFIGAAGDGTNVGTLAVSTQTPLLNGSGGSIDFSGGGVIAMPYNKLLNGTNAFSYEVWYNLNELPNNYNCTFWWRDEPVTGQTEGHVHYIQGSPAMNQFWTSDINETWDALNNGSQLAAGVWQHLLCTFDGSTKLMYLNGVLIAAEYNPILKMREVLRPVTSLSYAGYPLMGLMAEAAYYTNALSADRVQAHYGAAVGTAPPLVAVDFVTQPAADTTNFVGSTIRLHPLVTGTPPFTYQWLRDGTAVPGQTNLIVTLSPALVSDTGSYVLQVQSPDGTTNSSAGYVAILTAPATIVSGPVPTARRLQGAAITFSVDAGGSLPLTYQWQFNSTPIPGATNASLTLNNLQPPAAGNYSVTVTNVAGSQTSPTASLTVVPVTAGSYAATVVSDNAVAYWRLDETSTNAYDLAGGNDGTYDSGVTEGVAGALFGDPDKAATFPGSAGITVPWSAALNPYPSLSVEMWARPDQSGAGTERALFASRINASYGSHGYYLSANVNDQWEFDTGHLTSGIFTITGGETTNHAWYHVVATFDDSSGSTSLYVNGESVTNNLFGTGAFAPNNPTADGQTPGDLGIAKTTTFDPNGEGTYYFGDLDEVAFYNYALSAAQVAKHYAVGTKGVITPPTLSIAPAAGNQVVITWSKGLLLQASALTGPWSTNSTAVSPLTIAPSGPNQFYRVLAP